MLNNAITVPGSSNLEYMSPGGRLFVPSNCFSTASNTSITMNGVDDYTVFSWVPEEDYELSSLSIYATLSSNSASLPVYLGTSLPTTSLFSDILTLPQNRTSSKIHYDPPTNTFIMYGGSLAVYPFSIFHDFFSFDANTNTFSTLTPTGATIDLPGVHTFSTYDSKRRQIHYLGVKVGEFKHFVYDIETNYITDLTDLLSEIITINGAGRYGANGLYDPVNDCLVVFGGYSQTDPIVLSSDLLKFDITNQEWMKVEVLGNKPSARAGVTLLYDIRSPKIVMWGGYNNPVDQSTWPCTNELWILQEDFSSWDQIIASGTVPNVINTITSPLISEAVYVESQNSGYFDIVTYSGSISNYNYKLDLRTYNWSKPVASGDVPDNSHGIMVSDNFDQSIWYFMAKTEETRLIWKLPVNTCIGEVVTGNYSVPYPEISLGNLSIVAGTTWNRFTFEPQQGYKGKRQYLTIGGFDGLTITFNGTRSSNSSYLGLDDSAITYTGLNGADFTPLTINKIQYFLSIVLNSTTDHGTSLWYGRYNWDKVKIPGVGLLNIPQEGLSLDCRALTPLTIYYVYGYSNNGSLAIEASSTSPIISDGVWCKTGQPTSLLLGTFYPVTLSETVVAQDGETYRGVANVYNKLWRSFGVRNKAGGGRNITNTTLSFPLTSSTLWAFSVLSWESIIDIDFTTLMDGYTNTIYTRLLIGLNSTVMAHPNSTIGPSKGGPTTASHKMAGGNSARITIPLENGFHTLQALVAFVSSNSNNYCYTTYNSTRTNSIRGMVYN
jgi:hypothetical protein